MRRKASVLISTIIVFSVLVPVVLFMSYAVRISVKASNSYRASKEITFSLRAVIRSLSDGMKKFSVSQMVGRGWADEGVSIRITSNDGLLNLNSLLLPDCRTADPLYVSVFRRLCRSLRLPDYTACVLDYMDTDDAERIGGNERDVPNRMLLSTRELLQVSHITESYYEKIAPYVTVYSLGKINVNYAPALLLLSLDDRMTKDMVERIVTIRRKRRIHSVRELMKMGVPPSVLYRIGSILIFKAEYITADIRLQRDSVLRRYRVVMKREKAGGRLLYVGFE